MELLFPTLLACSECTFNRFMPSWYFFVLFRFLAVFLICRGRVDLVRAIGVIAVLEIPYFYAWRMGVISMYSELPDSHEVMIAGIGALLFETGVLHATVLFALTRFRYFTMQVAPRLLLRRVLMIIPVFLVLHFLQNQFAYSSFSSSRPH